MTKPRLFEIVWQGKKRVVSIAEAARLAGRSNTFIVRRINKRMSMQEAMEAVTDKSQYDCKSHNPIEGASKSAESRRIKLEERFTAEHKGLFSSFLTNRVIGA